MTVGRSYYNDNCEFSCRVLRARIADGSLPEGDVDERDVRVVDGRELSGYSHVHLFAGIGAFPLAVKRARFPLDVSLVTGGFPCQDISAANSNGAGIDGERSGLWREMLRIVRELRPDFVLVENSAMLLSRGFGRVLGDLASIGFDAEWTVLSACALGAPHTRERLFVVAYPHSVSSRGQRRRISRTIKGDPQRNLHYWQREPMPRRVAHGVPDRMDRHGAIGNAIVVPVAAAILTALRREIAVEGGVDEGMWAVTENEAIR